MKKIAKMTGLVLFAVSMLQLSNVSEASAGNTLTPGGSISHDGGITSADGRFFFRMQWDGNLVHYLQGGHSLWDSDTRGHRVSQYDPFLGRYFYRSAEKLTLFANGNLYITDLSGVVVFWKADTKAWMDSYYRVPLIIPTGLVGDTLIAQDDGNVVLYDTIGNSGGQWLPVWATDTGGR